jgi:uncharacterized surface protein with fasciclin (FAS1) repeats
MKFTRTIATAAASAALVAGALAGAGTANAASAAAKPAATLGSTSLASVVAPYASSWNHNWGDYNIVTHAVFAVLKAKPNSPVKVLADGKTPLTLFIPTDRAFQTLVGNLTGKKIATEQGVFNAVAGLGIDTVEAVLLYHVVPGATIPSSVAVKANGARLTTAQGGSIRVVVKQRPLSIRLADNAPRLRDPYVILSKVDINKGNVQIAHAISRVLLPVDLKPYVKPLGTRSLASVVAPFAKGFNHNWSDYNIVTHAVFAVLKAKPSSPVKVLADGKTPLTLFIPTDRAFQTLVKTLTGKTIRTEQGVFNAVAGLGVDKVEAVLLYHVVPGATIPSSVAVKANGARLTTAEGGVIRVVVTSRPLAIRLADETPSVRDPYVILWQVDINKGNRQIAHGINRVLLPAA